MLPLSLPATRTLWIGLLPVAATVLSFPYTCITPFAALAAAAALWFPGQAALLTVTLGWLANQLVGFSFLHYPHDASTLAWGGVLLLGSWTATEVGAIVSHWLPRLGRSLAARLLSAGLVLATAYVSVQLWISLAGLILNGDPFSLSLQRDLIALNAATFAGLLILASTVETLWRRHRRTTTHREHSTASVPVCATAPPEATLSPQPARLNATIIAFPLARQRSAGSAPVALDHGKPWACEGAVYVGLESRTHDGP